MAFPLLAPLVVTTAYTGFKAFLATFVSYGVVRIAVLGVILAVTSLAGYIVADIFIPDWFSVAALQAAIDGFSPASSYFLYLGGFYSGFPKVLTALCAAWVIKKIPSWAFIGPLLRGVS